MAQVEKNYALITYDKEFIDFDFEKYSLSKEDFKDLMYDEILLYHSDEAAIQYIEQKKKYPDGQLHVKYANRLRKAYKDQ